MKLVAASLEVPHGLEEFLFELGDGEHGFGGTAFASGQVTLDELLEALVGMAEGRGLAKSRVPMTTFWLVHEDGRMIGMSRLRHRLNDDLLNEGGHIGYYVRPGERRKGYGTALLALTLAEAKKLGVAEALVTADSDNPASISVIEANDGRLEDERRDGDRPYRRYWIAIDSIS